MPSAYTGINFVNQLEFNENTNAYTFRNFFPDTILSKSNFLAKEAITRQILCRPYYG